MTSKGTLQSLQGPFFIVLRLQDLRARNPKKAKMKVDKINQSVVFKHD